MDEYEVVDVEPFADVHERLGEGVGDRQDRHDGDDEEPDDDGPSLGDRQCANDLGGPDEVWFLGGRAGDAHDVGDEDGDEHHGVDERDRAVQRQR